VTKALRGRLPSSCCSRRGTTADGGFVMNHRKTRIMSQATRQHVTGLVVNRSAHAARKE
jgi:hypothetical protein